MVRKPRQHGTAATSLALEIYANGWRRVGEVRVTDPAGGTLSPARFEYDFDYLDDNAEALGAYDARAVSCLCPVGYESFEGPHWPAFLLDVMPSGAARRYWEAKLELPNTSSSDWDVLRHGASHPPGNVRVAGLQDRRARTSNHPGFARSDILERKAEFIEYAHSCGAPVSGSSGAGGDSPKFLLREDHEGRWHADGVLADERTKACWLVKFPRTPQDSDHVILEAEAAYHRVAARLGVRTHGEVCWEADCLFVPRFDRRVADGRVECLGLESLASLTDVAEFGVSVPKEKQAAAVARFSTDRKRDLRELLLRDVLDVALGNTDNHPRNTAMLKTGGTVTLSPLYDFAPMILDRRGIARVCRWSDGKDFPDWSRVADTLDKLGLEADETKEWMRRLADRMAELPVVMRECGVPAMVREQCRDRVTRVARALSEAR